MRPSQPVRHFCGLAEPALPLQRPAFHALGAEVGDCHALDPSHMRDGLVARGEEACIGGDQARHMAELLLMDIEGGNQQVGFTGSLVIDLVVSDDLLFGFLDLDHLAEFGGFAGLALADDLRVRLEQAHDLAGSVRVAAVDALAGLP